MKIPESWLREFVDPALSAKALAHALTMAGIEVETVEPVAPAFSGVVVAEVVEVGRHPNADRLTVCKVDIGSGTPVAIVCGAPNVAAGMKAPCATVGAELPDMTIRPVTMRGVESQGMLCSARELGLSGDHSGLLALSQDAPVGADFRDYLDLDDRVFTLKLTPNRADCLSVLGVAREVAAITGAKLRERDIHPIPARCGATHPVRISDPDGCGRFTGRVIRNVDAGAATPQWMKRRLERAGQRSISALVDVTNYVMLELGRPLHVYDLDRLEGEIDVRWGRKGERLKLLNEQTVEVYEDVLAITDASGAIGLAGIMGGDGTKADLGTRHILLESAFFFPAAIAGRARRYNFASDASHRFERGVDYDNNVAGIERATRLILDICGGEAGPVVDTVAKLPEQRSVRMRVARAHKVIGVPVPSEDIADIFARLGLAFTQEGVEPNEVFTVTAPSFRFDMEIEEDLIEEVARLYGFDRIAAHPPVAPAMMRMEPERMRSPHALREQLAACDYQEVINFSFVDESWEADFAGNANPIRLLNPIASQQSVMRSTLIGSLVANVRYNLNRKLGRIRVFEIGRVYWRDPAVKDGDLEVAGVRQPARIAAAAYGPAQEEQWGEKTRAVDFYDLKADLEALLAPKQAGYERALHPALHPGRTARVVLEGRPIGWLGELHPRWQKKYDLPGPLVLFELDVAPLLERDLPEYREVSKFPPVIRDLAVVVPETASVQGLLDEMVLSLPAVVQDIRLFDVYRGSTIGDGQKSLAFRVVMQDTAKTLTDEEADTAMARLKEVLASKFGARLRT